MNISSLNLAPSCKPFFNRPCVYNGSQNQDNKFIPRLFLLIRLSAGVGIPTKLLYCSEEVSIRNDDIVALFVDVVPSFATKANSCLQNYTSVAKNSINWKPYRVFSSLRYDMVFNLDTSENDM